MAKMRHRRTNIAIFLDALQSLGGGDVRVNNQRLRTELGWEQDKYNTIKDRLVGQGVIKTEVGGPGGAVRLLNLEGAIADRDENGGRKPIKIFISYSHSDATAKTKLVRMLKPLEYEYLMEVWEDGEIAAGDNWAEEINDKIENADIILLLVSVDFINSRYCASIEMKRALEREVDKQATVIPVLVRDCYWRTMPFKHLQGLPSDMKAIANWTNEDSAYLDVVVKIKEKLDELTE